MCNKVATPKEDDLKGYFDKQDENQRLILKVGDYHQYFHADGFTRPFLPFTASEEPQLITAAQWKLLPHVVKTDKDAWAYANTLNARSEEIFTKFSYKNYIGKQRGLLWVSGFYEPNHPRPKVTVPYFVRAHNFEPFTLGCVYANWLNEDTGEVVRTFSIITTPPNELLARIHTDGQRMPLIIKPEDRTRWLGPLDKDQIAHLMQPLPDGYLQAYPVSGLVYKRGADANIPEAQQPIALQDDLF